MASINFQKCKTSKLQERPFVLYCNEVWDWLRVNKNGRSIVNGAKCAKVCKVVQKSATHRWRHETAIP